MKNLIEIDLDKNLIIPIPDVLDKKERAVLREMIEQVKPLAEKEWLLLQLV
jgi:hypothetical protein